VDSEGPNEGVHRELAGGGVRVCGLDGSKQFRRRPLELVTATAAAAARREAVHSGASPQNLHFLANAVGGQIPGFRVASGTFIGNVRILFA